MNKTRVILAISTFVASGMFMQMGFNGQAWAEEGCSEATTTGAYGFHRSGVNPQGVPVDEIAILNNDGQGNFSSTGFLSLGDEPISQTSFAGTYVVNPDCSGIGYIGGVEVYRTVIVDGGKEFFALRMNPGAHQRASGKKMSEGCSEATLSGGYGFLRSGVNPQGTLVNEVAIAQYDGKGNWATGGGALSLGDELSIEPGGATGTYVVSPECSYIAYNAEGVEVYRGVVVDGGKEVFLLRMNPGAHQRASLKKM